MLFDLYQNPGNAKQVNVEKLIQVYYGIYEGRTTLEVYALFTFVAIYPERFYGDELIGRINILSP